MIHGIVRTFFRRLADLGLRRRLQPAPLLSVWNAIQMELNGPSKELYNCFSVLRAL